jgi:predicted nucleic acid-binding protein
VTLIDSNILLDILTDDPVWADWSIRRLDAAALKGSLAINDVVYAELSVRFNAIEQLDEFLNGTDIILAAMPRAASFLAGKVFQRYRASGGMRVSVLPDFFIGAHASVAGVSLLSRDARRYRTYFPNIDLITP